MNNMKKYKANVRFIFEGTVNVNAESKAEVRDIIAKHVHLCIGGHVHSSLHEEQIPGWEFSTHADKEIGRIKTL